MGDLITNQTDHVDLRVDLRVGDLIANQTAHVDLRVGDLITNAKELEAARGDQLSRPDC